jgi:hypothetical protein
MSLGNINGLRQQKTLAGQFSETPSIEKFSLIIANIVGRCGNIG